MTRKGDSHNPILIGYFPKHILPRPDWLKAPHVLDICSVSECMSPGPKDWISLWRHNDMFLYDSEESARSVARDRSENGPFEILAYRIVPTLFNNGHPEPFALPALGVQELSGDFQLLGFDIVSRSMGACFECSPLSCNGIAESEAVNAHCLVDDAETAVRLALAFSSQVIPCEPGPYCIMEVWRRTGAK
jgi:hypothetical protein